MPKYKQKMVDNPEQFEKNTYIDFAYHRSYFYRWEFLETVIYGGHKWNAYKTKNTNFNPELELSKYFSDYKKYAKQLENLLKQFGESEWLESNKLYITVIHGDIDIKSADKTAVRFYMNKKEDRNTFKSRNILNVNDFLRWVLLVAAWENIDSIKVLIDRFFFLYEKFKIFMRIDMTPAMLTKYFNEKLMKITDHNIEPIQNVQIYDFYKFAMNPLVYSISIKSAVDKLFYFISASNYLKGTAYGFKPSFNKYTEQLDKIFGNEYYKRPNAHNIRRLESNELLYFDFQDNPQIKTDIIIPDKVIEEYTDISVDKKVSESLTESEIRKYTEALEKNKREFEIKKSSEIDSILDKYESVELPKTKAEIKKQAQTKSYLNYKKNI